MVLHIKKCCNNNDVISTYILGIRILISSVSSEKAKYKSILNDWVVGFCLFF